MNAPAVRLVVGELEGVACSRTLLEEDIAMLESVVARKLSNVELLRAAAVLEHVRREVAADWERPEDTHEQELLDVYGAARLRGLSREGFLAWVEQTIAAYEARR